MTWGSPPPPRRRRAWDAGQEVRRTGTPGSVYPPGNLSAGPGGSKAVTVSAGFDDFVVMRSPRLLRTAYLLTHDWALAEDLVQTALARAWEAWPRIEGDPEPYVRRIIVNSYASWWRRRWTGELPTDVLPERAHPADAHGGVDERDRLWRGPRPPPPPPP